jgi:hypothetical protein
LIRWLSAEGSISLASIPKLFTYFMSIHAQLSPEALERLRAQRRNTTISALVISLLSLVFIGILLALWLLPIFRIDDEPVIAYAGDLSKTETPIEQKKVATSQQKPSAPSSAISKVIASSVASPVSIPVPDINVPTPSEDFGNSNDFGEGWGGSGDGNGGGSGFAGIPAGMKSRCSREDRLKRLATHGGTEACEEAVLKGLRWLKQSQNADGSWERSNSEAMTGLALLAYLGHCETPLSEEFGDSVLRAITYLVDFSVKNKGYLTNSLPATGGVYEHAIAAYALAEAYTFCSKIGIPPIPNLKESVEKATNIIISGQHPSGGWAYGYIQSGGNNGDMSISGWQVQALKAANHTGIEFRDMRRCIDKALAYMVTCQAADGGFGYTASRTALNGSHFALTGVGVLSHQMWDKSNAREARNGIDYIKKNPGIAWGKGEKNTHSDIYAAYYESQAMMNAGGNDWLDYNKTFRDSVLKNQASNGTWPATQDAHHGLNGNGGWNEHYRTCLCILMLEVYYRFLPGTGGGK